MSAYISCPEHGFGYRVNETQSDVVRAMTCVTRPDGLIKLTLRSTNAAFWLRAADIHCVSDTERHPA